MEKKLYRSKADRKFSGVCAGIANYVGIDVTIIRLLWVFCTIVSVGTGFILYIICMFIIPEEPDFIDGEYTEKDII